MFPQDSKKFWLDWIEKLKTLKCLWDEQSVDYKNRELREEAYEELAKIVGTDADKQFVRTRINSLRSAYRREAKKVIVARENGILYKPKLFYYDSLNSFLRLDGECNQDSDARAQSPSEKEGHFSSLQTRSKTTLKLKNSEDTDDQRSDISFSNNKKKISNNSRTKNNEVNISDDDLNDNSTIIQRKGQNSSHLQIRKKRKYSSRTQDIESSSEEDKVIKKISKRTETEDEWDTLGRRFATHFRSMKSKQRLLAEKIISDVCIYARLNQLTLQSGLTLENPSDYQHFNTLSYSGNQSSEEQMEETHLDQDSRDT